MVRQASIAHHYSVSFNPRTSEAEKAADKIMQDLLAKNFTQKQIILDAVLRAGGVDPLTFDDSGLTVSGVQSLLEHFADHIIGELRTSGLSLHHVKEADPDGESSPFAKRLAQSYANRKVDP